MFEWRMKAPIRIRNIQGVILPVSFISYFVEVAKEAGFEPFEMREFDCPYKSEVPCYELVMRASNNDVISFGSSIHSFQFFIRAKGIVYTSNLHPTAHYFARVEYTAIVMELYPKWLSSSDLVRKFMAKMKDKTGRMVAVTQFKRYKKNVRTFQMLFLGTMLGQVVREKQASKIASNTKS